MRLRLILALALVGLGSTLAVGQPAGLLELGRALWARLDVILIAIAIITILATVAPRGSLGGAVVFGSAGLAVHLGRRGGWSAPDVWLLLGAGAVAAGGWLAMTVDVPEPDQIDPVRRRIALLFPRRIGLAGRRAPDILSVVAVGTCVRVDLSAAKAPKGETIELLISCWAARVELAVPARWPVVAGRLASAHAIRFCGELDLAEPTPFPHLPEQAARLTKVTAERTAAHERSPASGRAAAIVIHVLGLAGEVTIVGR
jgi:hypothetical protein